MSIGLNIVNNSVVRDDFVGGGRIIGHIDEDDFSPFGLETLDSNGVYPNKKKYGSEVSFFGTYNLLGDTGHKNGFLTTGEVLLAFGDLDEDNTADKHINSIGTGALTDYLKAAKVKSELLGGYTYKDALQYLFSGLFSGGDKVKKAEQLAEILKGKTPAEIVKYLNSSRDTIITDDEVKKFKDMHDLFNSMKNWDLRPKSQPKEAYWNLESQQFQDIDMSMVTSASNKTLLDANDFIPFQLGTMAKGVTFGSVSESYLFETYKQLDDNKRMLSTPEALLSIANYEISPIIDDNGKPLNDGYANARLDYITYQNLKAYIDLAQKFYSLDQRKYKKALTYIFSALLPLSERAKANEMGDFFGTKPNGVYYTSDEILFALNQVEPISSTIEDSRVQDENLIIAAEVAEYQIPLLL